MKFFLVLVIVLGAGACGGTSPRSSSTISQTIPQPPTGPEISQNPPTEDIAAQLTAMAFLPPDKNNTKMWYRDDPAGGTKVELNGQKVTAFIFPREGGDVRCTVDGPFPPHLQQLEGALDRTTLLGHPGCK